MNKTFIVTKWEYLEKVKTKSFLISMILFPLIILGMSLLPQYFATKEDSEIKVFGYLEKDINIYPDFVKSLENYKLDNGQPNYLIQNLAGNFSIEEAKKIADSLVFSQKIRGYLLLEKVRNDSFKLEFRGENVSNIRDLERFENKINYILTNKNYQSAGLDIKLIEKLKTEINLKPIKISKTGEEVETHFSETFIQGYVFTLILMMMILITGGMLIRSVVEEKSNRIIEVLISSCTAKQLMTGKILGLSALGLTQILVWQIIGFSIAGPIGLTMFNLDTLFLTLIYFFLGYIFYAAIFVSVGSIANSEQEAQQFTSYLSLLLIAPIFLVFQMMNEPDALLVKILSYFPLTTSPIMTMKINILKPDLIEVFITIGIMLISIYIMTWIAGQIFRIGILSYGKSPNLKQIISWIKSK